MSSETGISFSQSQHSEQNAPLGLNCITFDPRNLQSALSWHSASAGFAVVKARVNDAFGFPHPASRA